MSRRRAREGERREDGWEDGREGKRAKGRGGLAGGHMKGSGEGERCAHLHGIRAIEVEEDGAQREHLLAVVCPARLYHREEGARVRRLAEQPLEASLDV